MHGPRDLDIVVLFREHAGRVEQLLRRFGVAERDLADATQEVFVVVHRKLSEFEGRASVSTWLYQICLRVASSERRRARHRREVMNPDTAQEAESAQLDAHGELERRRLLEHIADALDQLNEAQRSALVLHELEGLQVREIARRLRVPVKTAFSRLYAARAQVRELLRRRGYAVSAWFPLWPSASWRAWPARRPAAISGGQIAALAICTVLLAPTARPVEPHAIATSAPLALAPSVPPMIAPTLQQTNTQPAAKRATAHPVQRGPAPAPAPAAAASEPAPVEELTLIRMSSVDLTPPVEHPFAAKLRATTPRGPRLPPMAARLAPSSFDPEF